MHSTPHSPARNATQKVDRRHWQLAVAAGMASFLDSAAIISVGLGLALWEDHYNLNVWLVGLLGSVMTLFIALGALFGGRLADLFGRGRMFSITILVYAVGALMVAFAPNSALLIAGVVVIGIAAGADLPTSIAVLSERAPDHARGRLVAFTHVMWTVGVVVATALGFAVATLGVFGISTIFAVLSLLAITTFAFRAFYPPFRELDAEAHRKHIDAGLDPDTALPLKAIFSNRVFAVMIILTAGFYLFFTLVANTFGAYKTYFLVTVGGADQSAATLISFLTTLIGLAGTIVFTRIADTPWRNRFYFVGVAIFALCQIMIAVTGGTILPVMIAALVLYNVAFPFIGEALYKVWTQESFPVNARATVQGTTIAIARFVAFPFTFFTPALIEWSPTGLYLLLAGFVLVSGIFGTVILRRLAREHRSGAKTSAEVTAS